jgi:hypothetical protein
MPFTKVAKRKEFEEKIQAENHTPAFFGRL